jgi:uncharacterized protein
MARVIYFALFLLLMVLVYFFSHYYIYLRLSKVLNINKKIILVGIIALALLFFLANFLIRTFDNTLSRAIYFISATWIGVLLFLIIGFALVDLIYFISSNSGKTLDYKTLSFVMLVLVVLISGYALYNARSVKINEVTIKVNNLPNDINNLKILQMSDLHLGAVNSADFMEKLVERSNSLEPDLVLITGDVFDGTTGINEEMVAPLKNLKSKYGTYFTTGNHETYAGLDESVRLIELQNVTVLRNEIKNISGVQLIGIDYPASDEFSQNNTELAKLKNQIDKNKTSILMYHSPSGLQESVNAGINLQLSGHLHNGQVFPFSLLQRVLFKYVSGQYKIQETNLYVSQGAGTWGPPMRLGSHSEIALITLKR